MAKIEWPLQKEEKLGFGLFQGCAYLTFSQDFWYSYQYGRILLLPFTKKDLLFDNPIKRYT